MERERRRCKEGVGTDMLKGPNQPISGSNANGNQRSNSLNGICVRRGYEEWGNDEWNDAIWSEPSGPKGPACSLTPDLYVMLRQADECRPSSGSARRIDSFDLIHGARHVDSERGCRELTLPKFGLLSEG